MDSNLLDLSNYDHDHAIGLYGDLRVWANTLREQDVTQVIVGCQRPSKSRAMIEALQAAGIEVIATYAFLYFGIDVIPQTVAAVEIAQEFNIPHVALDCESEAGSTEAAGLTPENRIGQLRAACAVVEAAGLKVIIYTGAYWWPGKMGNTVEFSKYPLWIANYGANDPDAPRGPLYLVSFGGWSAVTIHQYSSTIIKAGRGTDHNYLIQELSDMGMTAEEKKAFQEVQALTFAMRDALGGQEALAAWNASGNSLLLGYSLEQGEQNEVESKVGALAQLAAKLEKALAESGASGHTHAIRVAVGPALPDSPIDN